MEQTKWVVTLISAMLIISALAGVFLGIKEEFDQEKKES